MRHRHVVVVVAHVRPREERWRVLEFIARRRALLHAAKVLADGVHELAVVDGARRRDHHPRRRVVRLHVPLDVVDRDRTDVLLRAEDRAGERRADVRDLVEAVEDDLFDLRLDLLHLAHDHVALALDARLRERRGRGEG